MRICLFTDTLGDVNGVSRFIRNVAEQAQATGRDLRVLTSTKFEVPDRPNILNFPPIIAGKMPRYENLEFVIPPALRMLRYIRDHRPDAIHISTPGPVGTVGRLAARRYRIPVLGVYHTDFPAYIDHLFTDDAMTWGCARFMSYFYNPFASVFTRSDDYRASLMTLGIADSRIVRLKPGIDTTLFDPAFRDPTIWKRLGVPDGVKVIYCGRVSVEKNLPLLRQVWPEVRRACTEQSLAAQLIVVGDGPYRETMERELGGTGAHFLGFKHGRELSTIYASSDLFVFPSLTDTLGQVVMESQCSGLPVIVTDHGGPKEVVRRGETGLVLPASPHTWAAEILSLIRDTTRRTQWGAAARESIKPMSIRHSFDHFWDVHKRAVRQGPNPVAPAA
jgi:glycosyltransferase involved in cell wall biosynthesis